MHRHNSCFIRQIRREFTNGLKVAGTGYFEVGVSAKDRNLALVQQLHDRDRDLEMDETVESQRAGGCQA